MGMALSTLDVPCAKTFSSLLCFTKDEVAACEPSNCIRCGRCISVCPAGLMLQSFPKSQTTEISHYLMNSMDVNVWNVDAVLTSAGKEKINPVYEDRSS